VHTTVTMRTAIHMGSDTAGIIAIIIIAIGVDRQEKQARSGRGSLKSPAMD
jgi:hypothetical protein